MPGFGREPERDNSDVIGARIGAQIVDSIMMVILFFIVTILLGGLGGAAGGESDAGGGLFFGLMFGAIASVLYGFFLEGMWDGFTVGKKLFGIKVVKENGEPCGLGGAFVRNLLEIIDGLFYYLIGFIAMAMSDKRQRIGDRLAGTVVVRESAADTGEIEDPNPQQAPG